MLQHSAASFCTMARQLRLLSLLRPNTVPCNYTLTRRFTETAKENPYYNVPAGHQSSDLTDSVCHIGLGRLRDLTLRQDLSLATNQGLQPLKDVFKGKRVVLFGVPDMGKVCTEKHAPSYTKAAAALQEAGVQKVYCVAVSTIEELQSWAAKLGLDDKEVEVAADEGGAFTRALGLEIGTPDAAGPQSQRYAALVDDGILLKLKVEANLGEVTVSHADAMVSTIKDYFER